MKICIVATFAFESTLERQHERTHFTSVAQEISIFGWFCEPAQGSSSLLARYLGRLPPLSALEQLLLSSTVQCRVVGRLLSTTPGLKDSEDSLRSS
jgi:hypothetical protein